MKKIAILLTVYNRKEVTMLGLASLFSAIKKVNGYKFDIYMTNDGCTDDTDIEVHSKYPSINIIDGKGNLYWSKGMNLSWKYAVDSNDYDYYIWFNDDAMLYENAINTLLDAVYKLGDKTIITGAFKDSHDCVSYGGRNSNNIILIPDGSYQDVYLMNGNLVLISKEVFKINGFIDSHFHHGLGDWDYGLSARKKGLKVVLTKEYIGETDRHDEMVVPYLDRRNGLMKRLKLLYSPRCSITCKVYYIRKHFGLLKACKIYLASHFYTLFPFLYKNINK